MRKVSVRLIVALTFAIELVAALTLPAADYVSTYDHRFVTRVASASPWGLRTITRLVKDRNADADAASETEAAILFDVGSSLKGSGVFTGGTLTATTTFIDDISLVFGTGSDASFTYNTTQTPDTLVIGVGADSRNIIVVEKADTGFDFAHALDANPAFYVHSTNQSTTEYNGLTTDAVFQHAVWRKGAFGSGWMWVNNATNVARLANNGQLTLADAGGLAWSSNPSAVGTNTELNREGAATLQMGADANGAAINQTFKAHDGITGTDIKGASLILAPGIGTGSAVSNPLIIQRQIVKATGTTAQTYAPAYTVCPTRTLSNTSATAQTLAIVDLASNSAAGGEAHITVTCSDGTNFDAETQVATFSAVNKATVLTISTPTITASSAANNSGSCTIGFTAVAGTNQVLLKVTPVFTTIVPTTVTAYLEVITHQPSSTAVACQ